MIATLVLLGCTALQDLPAGPVPGAPAPGATITRVVVFPKHAEVTRELEVQAVDGANAVVFAGLASSLNPHTLRASVSEGARVTGTELRSAWQPDAVPTEVAALDARIQSLQDQLALDARTEARLAEEAAFLRGIKGRLADDAARELAGGRVAVEDWRQVLDFVGNGLAACDTRLAELALAVRERQASLALLGKERQDYAARAPAETKAATVTFLSEGAGRRRVALHSIVDSVAWAPSYDVHLDRAAGEVELVGYGQVVQWSGEHWPDVQLTLAMSRPDLELSVPELQPLTASLDDKEMAQLAKEVSFLGTGGPEQVRKWTEGRFKRSQEREIFRRNLEQLSRRSDQHLAQYGLSQALIADAMDRLVDRFAGVRYEIPRRESIPCDSSTHKVVAFTARLPARLTYVATPALGGTVMLQAACTNTSGVPVLAGGTALFIDDDYVGAGSVASAAKNEPLSFGFGPDDSLRVERRLVAREVKGPEAFRQSQVLTYRYEISLQNFNPRPVEVEVADQVPVSKTPDIQVTFLEASPEPVLDKATGTLRWSLQAGASATTTIRFAFSVECPVGRDVHWL